MEKSKNLHQQLKDLKSEIEVLKVEEKQTHLDRLHEEKSEAGDNKFVTLQKVSIRLTIFFKFVIEKLPLEETYSLKLTFLQIKSGTTKARVAFFEEL